MHKQSLSDLLEGEVAVIAEVKESPLRMKLQEMGFTKGTAIKRSFQAPFNGPIAFEIGNTLLSLRLDEAALVEAIKISANQ